MTPVSLETVFDLSSMQKGVLFHTLSAPESSVYINQSVFTLDGELNVRALERAWQRVTDRHQVLRCSFFWEGIASPVQAVHRHVRLPVDCQNWSRIREDDHHAELERLLRMERARPFDLRRPPQMRVTLCRVGPRRHWLVWTRHHILFDGWSQGLLLGEVFQLYEAFCLGDDIDIDDAELVGPRVPFERYIAWLREHAVGDAERFWRTQLAGHRRQFLVGSRARPSHDAPPVQREHAVELDPQVAAALESLARRSGVTVSTIQQAAWALVLGAEAQTPDVVFGLTVSGRPPAVPGVEAMVGLFINTLPVRVTIDEAATFEAFAKGLQAQQIRLGDYQHTPLSNIQRWCGLPPGAAPFDSIVVIGNYPLEFLDHQHRSSLRVVSVRGEVQNSFALTLRVMPGAIPRVSLLHDERVIEASSVARILDGFVGLLERVPRDFGRPVSDFSRHLTDVEHARRQSALDRDRQRLAGRAARARSRA